QAATYTVRADAEDPEDNGLYLVTAAGPFQLANFSLLIEREVRTCDEFRTQRRFEGTLTLHGHTVPFAIGAADYGDDRAFRAAIYETAGAEARFLGRLARIRDAISDLSQPEREERSTDFGWTPDRSAYAVPSGVIDGDGYREYRPGEARVDLSD